MKVACAFDHAGVPLAGAVLGAVNGSGHEPLDLGHFDDYPNAVLEACNAVHTGAAERAVIVGNNACSLVVPSPRSCMVTVANRYARVS